jgi:hypothetical protein
VQHLGELDGDTDFVSAWGRGNGGGRKGGRKGGEEAGGERDREGEIERRRE